VNPLRGVGGKLALALLVVVAGALAIVYVVVVPSYESSLVDARLKGLDRALQKIISDTSPTYMSQSWVEEEAAPLANERVVVFETAAGHIIPYSDSSPPRGTSRDVLDDPIALRALARQALCTNEQPFNCLSHGTVTRDGERFAEAALPVTPEVVIMISSPLRNDLESVSVVRSRVLVAGALAILFAIVLGYALALLFTRRIRRLDRAAARISAGRFDSPVVDASADEIGQLARTFERMRLRLASLERARAEFIANASHELRTPLFSLAGSLELLASEEMDAETRADFMASVRGQVTRLTKLATDLLDLSRMDAGRLAVATDGLDLAALGEVLATEFSGRVNASGHVLAVDEGDTAPAVGDEERVLQIGRILIENAIVHTPPGTEIRVTADAHGAEARLTVTDNGPGIAVEAQPHVFERFYRLEGGRASGSGLGLAIASELATLMNGRIELVSVPGATRFTLALPIDVAERPNELLEPLLSP
jgi:signal transduction histidine kinase